MADTAQVTFLQVKCAFKSKAVSCATVMNVHCDRKILEQLMPFVERMFAGNTVKIKEEESDCYIEIQIKKHCPYEEHKLFHIIYQFGFKMTTSHCFGHGAPLTTWMFIKDR